MSFIKSYGKKIWKRKWIVLIVFVVAAGMFFYYRSTAKAQLKKEEYVVKRDNIQENLTLTGSIDAQEHVTLKFQTAGRLAWVGVKEGDTVTKGQAIASLDQRDVEGRLKKYLNIYESTRSAFDQVKDENEDAAVNGKNDEAREAAKRLITESQSSLDNAVIDYELQTIAREYANLYSPIDGIVVKASPTTPGVNTAVTDAVYEIVNPNTLYFSAQVDQTEVVQIHEGQQGTIIFDAYPDNKTTGTITSIAYTPMSGETGTVYEVKVMFDPTTFGAAGYRLGMTGDIEFTLKEIKDVLVIPSLYIRTEGTKKYIYKLENGQQKKLYITTGEESDGIVEIVDGLKEGDTIVEVSDTK